MDKLELRKELIQNEKKIKMVHWSFALLADYLRSASWNTEILVTVELSEYPFKVMAKLNKGGRGKDFETHRVLFNIEGWYELINDCNNFLANCE